MYAHTLQAFNMYVHVLHTLKCMHIHYKHLICMYIYYIRTYICMYACVVHAYVQNVCAYIQSYTCTYVSIGFHLEWTRAGIPLLAFSIMITAI